MGDGSVKELRTRIRVGVKAVPIDWCGCALYISARGLSLIWVTTNQTQLQAGKAEKVRHGGSGGNSPLIYFVFTGRPFLPY